MSPYKVLSIEKRRDGTFWVLDKRGPNVVEAGPFQDMTTAQRKWRDIADDIHIEAIMATSDADALAGRWPKPEHSR